MPIIDQDDLEIPEFLKAENRDPIGKALEEIEAAEEDEEIDLGLGDNGGPALDDEDEEEEEEPEETPRGKRGPSQIAKDQLKAIVERIEKLEEEKAAIAGDIKEVYSEAKANGYDTKVLRGVVRDRKRDAAERQETEALRDLYFFALGME